ncbi:MAG: hypothetical protein MHPDNHAH_01047 [Anaerolineales bacterium]|nr:hypothetical protein [Anaerolineales bacterium]
MVFLKLVLDFDVELGEKDATSLTLALSQRERGCYPLIFFKNPGVFNSRSSR